jgi:hypothetical protein
MNGMKTHGCKNRLTRTILSILFILSNLLTSDQCKAEKLRQD